jgi:hypothetical protein
MTKNKVIRNLLLWIVLVLMLPLFLRAVFGPVHLLEIYKARTIDNNALLLFIAMIALWLWLNRVHRVLSAKIDFLFLLVLFLTVFQHDVQRLHVESDGVGYFSYLHTMYMDRDLDFTNEYADLDAYRYGVWAYADLEAKIPKTSAVGMVPNNFSIGPALLWYPFYGFTDLIYRTNHPQRTGYETPYLQSVHFASLFYGFAGVLLLYVSLLRFFSRTVSLTAVLTILFLSPLYFYLKNLAFYSHVYSFFAVSLFLYFFAKYHESERVGHWAAFGLLVGFSALMRWQNAVFIAIPGLMALLRFWRVPKEGRTVLAFLAKLTALGSGFVLALIPQLLAFQILFGKFWLIPQGDSFMTLWPRWGWQALFSPFHGLFHWHPFLFFGLLGFFLRRMNRSAAANSVFYSGAAGFALQSYVNGSIRQFHGGGSFGGRRFCDSLAFLAFGIANFIERILGSKKSRIIFLIIGNLFFVLNAMMEKAWAWRMLSLDLPVPFQLLAGHAGQAFVQFSHGPHKQILFFVFSILFINLYAVLLFLEERRVLLGKG